jgi:hypothetical protein
MQSIFHLFAGSYFYSNRQSRCFFARCNQGNPFVPIPSKLPGRVRGFQIPARSISTLPVAAKRCRLHNLLFRFGTARTGNDQRTFFQQRFYLRFFVQLLAPFILVY